MLVPFASCTLASQTQFSQTAPLLLPVTRQQNMMGYWWEGSASIVIPPTSASDIVGQHHKTGGCLEQPSYFLNCNELNHAKQNREIK